MDFSLIVPSYNEEGGIRAFYDAATTCLDKAGLEYELIFVDDGSADATLEKLHELAAQHESDLVKDPAAHAGSIEVISFSRNFGKESAMLAGLNKATGNYVGFIDADLQQLPETALEMYAILQDHPEFDCVAAVQKKRKEGAVLKFFKEGFYRVFNTISETEIPPDASDFRVFSAQVANALRSMPEYFRFSKGLFSWVGFRTYTIEYEPEERFAGETNWSFKKLMNYALGGIFSFSRWPLKLTLYLGLITSAGAVIYLFIVLFEALAYGIDVPGYPTLACLILLFNGILMLVLGIMGEYLGRIYVESKNRPLYITREEFSSTPSSAPDRK